MQGTLFNYTHWSDTQLVQAHEPSNFHKINVKIWARNIMKYVGNNGSRIERKVPLPSQVSMFLYIYYV